MLFRSTDFYVVCQHAAGSAGELPALLDSSVARALGASVRAYSAGVARSARRAEKKKIIKVLVIYVLSARNNFVKNCLNRY